MSVESYSALDESSLRALLDGTMDLDERRLIRSAIRELRRREIQDMEAALASKRFRPTRVKPQEDKENQHRSESSDSLDILSQKLQGIKDIDELTKMLRSASDYEERKVIRAAIRQIREEQQQVEKCKGPGGVESQSGVGAQQVTERDIQQTTPQQKPEEHKTGSSSGMVLVFDPLVKDEGLLQREAPDPHPLPGPCLRSDSASPLQGPRLRSDSASSDHSTGSVHSYRSRHDSGASERSQHSQGTSQRGRLDSGASDQSGSSLSRLRQRLDSDRSESSPRTGLGSSERSVSVCSDDRGPSQEPVTNGSTHSTDSETETKLRDQTDGAGLSRPGPKHGLTNGSIKGKTEFLTQKITINNSLNNGKPKDAVLEHFTRTNSVRDRMRKFTESTQNTAPAVKSTSLRNVRNGVTSSKINAVFTPAPLSGQPQTVTSGGTNRPPSTADQSQSSGGRTEPSAEKDAPGLSVPEEDSSVREQDADMKTFLTIEIKDGRTTGTSSTGGPITTNALGQRAELTLGLRATPFKISSSSFNSAPTIKMETEPCVASEPVFSAPPSLQVGCPAPNIPNGSPSQTTTVERSGKLTAEQLAAIEDEELLDKMLDESKDFDERRLIRAALRDLRKRKRDMREKERESRLQELRQQRDQRGPRTGVGAGPGAGAEVVMRKVEKAADGSTLSQVTKTDRFAQSDDGSKSTRSTVVEASYVQKTDRGTIQSKSFSYSSLSSSSTSVSSTTRKVGSVFDREDDSSSRGAAERKQAERRKELMRAQTMPKSTMQARKAMMDRLEPGGSSGSSAVAKINRVQRSTSFGVPNANSIKQMLLDWCRAKTRSYEHVDIQNFSSSWSSGMAFCALVHHFFPEAFDYSDLSPTNRRHNFEVAFSTAERMVDCPQLLDVDDMVKMREPDWKCVYTYLQEFYRGLVTKGLVKTRNNC